MLPDRRSWVPILFLVFVFLTGGDSRSDIASLPFLRGVSVLFACWAITGMTREDWHRIRTPLALLLALTAWIAIQLIPLGPSLWHALPGRETIVAIDRLLGQPDLWRPLSLTPSQTFNSLLAMTVPVTALLLFARVDAEDYPRLLYAIVAIACFSVILGFVQILSGPASSAYLYRIANFDSMVGLFANRNHYAVFLAMAVIVIAMFLRDELMRKRKRGTVRIALAILGLGLAVMTVLIGSRAGMAAGIAAFVMAYIMVGVTWRGSAAGSDPRPAVAGSAARFSRLAFYAPPLLLTLLLGIALWVSDRTTAISRMVGDNEVAELRVQAWPVLTSMLDRFWAFGSGFGSFPAAYKIFEPDRLLQPSYFNHAHNDWMELAISGGLPALLILAIAIVWFARSFAARGVRNLVKGHRGDVRLPVLTAVLILAAASLVDYPLRVPSIQAVAILMIILLCCPKPATARQE